MSEETAISTNVGTILVVEDEITNRIIIEKILKDYHLLVASTGAEAIKIFTANKHEISLVLLDRMLPDISGDEICKMIRQEQLERKISIIFLTAQDSAEDVKSGLEVGANDYLRKPVKPIELLARVKTHLEAIKSRELEINLNNLNIVHHLMARLNHELRNSMTIINGVVLTWKTDNEKEKENLEIMKQSLKHMTDVLDKISKIQELKFTSYANSSKMLDF